MKGMQFIRNTLPGLLLIFLTCFLVRDLNLPAPLASSAPVDQFSAHRAAVFVKEIAASPRPLGTDAHTKAQAAIAKRLQQINLEPVFQTTVIANESPAERWKSPTPVARITNVLARIEGEGKGQDHSAILLMAHYDSVPSSPGAGDDASGVAELLEVASNLRASPLLKRDVILLFTDGEEIGLLGAKAFVEKHPWASDVGAIINVEARGNQGPSLLFESTPEASALLRQATNDWAENFARPLASSLFFEIYQRLPNDTDLTVWRGHRLPAVNLAFIDGLTHYHSQLDKVENLSLESIQDQGNALLGLTRTFANAPTLQEKTVETVLFTPWGRSWVSISVDFARVLALFSSLLLLVAVIAGFFKGHLTLSRFLMGLLSALLSTLIAAGSCLVVWLLVRSIFEVLRVSPMGDVYSPSWYEAGLIAITIGVAWWISKYAVKRLGTYPIYLGSLLLWMGLLATSLAAAPGGSYLPNIIVFTGSIALLINAFLPRMSASTEILACGVGIVLIVPLAMLLFSALSVGGGIIPAFLLALLFCMCLPVLQRMDVAISRWLPCGLILGGITIILTVASLTHINSRQPSTSNLLYVLDADKQAARWATTDIEPNPWISHYIGPNPEVASTNNLPGYLPTAAENASILPAEFRFGPAPLVTLPTSKFEVLESIPREKGRYVRVRFFPPSNTSLLTIEATQDVGVLSAVVDGERMRGDIPGRRWSIRYWSPSSEGVIVELELADRNPLKLNVIQQFLGLPQGLLEVPRPAETIPVPFMGFIADASIVYNIVEI